MTCPTRNETRSCGTACGAASGPATPWTASGRRRRRGPWQLIFRKKSADDLPAHRLVAETLTAPVAEDEETGERIGEVIAVLALGVMGHHWDKELPPPELLN